MVTGILEVFSLLDNFNNFTMSHGSQNKNSGKEIFSLKMCSFHQHVEKSARVLPKRRKATTHGYGQCFTSLFHPK